MVYLYTAANGRLLSLWILEMLQAVNVQRKEKTLFVLQADVWQLCHFIPDKSDCLFHNSSCDKEEPKVYMTFLIKSEAFRKFRHLKCILAAVWQVRGEQWSA